MSSSLHVPPPFKTNNRFNATATVLLTKLWEIIEQLTRGKQPRKKKSRSLCLKYGAILNYELPEHLASRLPVNTSLYRRSTESPRVPRLTGDFSFFLFFFLLLLIHCLKGKDVHALLTANPSVKWGSTVELPLVSTRSYVGLETQCEVKAGLECGVGFWLQ